MQRLRDLGHRIEPRRLRRLRRARPLRLDLLLRHRDVVLMRTLHRAPSPGTSTNEIDFCILLHVTFATEAMHSRIEKAIEIRSGLFTLAQSTTYFLSARKLMRITEN